MNDAPPLNKQSPIPLYYQLAEELGDKIRNGTLPPGARLPGERELSEQFGISRMTVRQALAYLTRQGAIVAHQGQGTFVSEPKLAHDTLHLLSFTEEMLRQGQAPTSRVIEQSRLPAPKAVARQLSLLVGDAVTKIVRLRYSVGAPLLLETVYVPQSLAPGLELTDLSQASLYQVLEERYALRLNQAQQSLEAITANEAEAGLFGIAAGTAMLMLQGVTFAHSGQPAEYFKAIYRGDRFMFQLESRRDLGSSESVTAPRMSVVMR